VLVVKPALAGDPRAVRALLVERRADVVFSSAFETAIGRRAALALAFAYAGPRPRALGFDTGAAFADPRANAPTGPVLAATCIEAMDTEAAWNAPS